MINSFSKLNGFTFLNSKIVYAFRYPFRMKRSLQPFTLSYSETMHNDNGKIVALKSNCPMEWENDKNKIRNDDTTNITSISHKKKAKMEKKNSIKPNESKEAIIAEKSHHFYQKTN